MSTVLVPGTFDLLHFDHARLLVLAAEFGKVTVALSTDAFAAQYKRWPKDPYLTRRNKLLALPSVEAVIARPEFSIVQILDEVRPSYWVTGNDWWERHSPMVGLSADELTARDITMIYVPRGTRTSTTELLSA